MPQTATEAFFLTSYQSPLGPYTIVSSPKGVTAVNAGDLPLFLRARWQQQGISIREGDRQNDNVARQLDEYFAGRRHKFTLPLDLRGTPFQHQVWELLRDIPYGETRSYCQIAQDVGRPTAVRATAKAVASNPIGIIVPCHRVIGASGKLVGYADGLDRKEALLNLERQGHPQHH